METKRVSHYKLIAPLGQGGMGVVWEAVDEMLGRSVAVKFPAESPASSGQLASEARAACRLNHPNVAQIYEFGETEEAGAFIAMELVRGRTLRDAIASGRMPWPEAVRIARSVAEALREAHREGILHLDIKPGNIAVNERGVVKVLDFGLAKMLPKTEVGPDEDSITSTLTLTRQVRGTPSYMSPEQARGEPLDQRSDLFSLGAVLYECLTGRRAFQGGSVAQTLASVVATNPPAPSTIAPDAPPWLDRLSLKLLAKDRQARYASAEELIADLDRRAAPAPPKRKAWIAAGLSAVALMVVGAGAVRVWHPWQSHTMQGAVLPVENLSGRADEAAFCDGLGEIIADVLSRPAFAHTIWVLPANDVRRFAVRTAADARRTLHAELVVTGAARRTDGDAGWAITVAVAGGSGPHVLGSRTVLVGDHELQELEPKLTAALTDLLNVKAGAATANVAVSPAVYARFVAARGLLRQSDRGDNLKRAVTELESISDAAPGYAPGLVALSEAYYRTYAATKERAWLAKADQAVRRAAEINANEPGIHVMLGRILRATGQTDEAIRELLSALAADPEDVVALLQLAGAYAESGRAGDAEATYEKATQLRPSYYPAYNNLAILYMSQGRWKEAEEPMRLVTELAPEYADGFTNMGALEYHLNRLQESLKMFSRSLELKPTAAAYRNRCGVEFDLRAWAGALADCRKAVELQPEDAIGWGNLGDVLTAMGNEAGARDAYGRGLDAGRKALTINPKDSSLMASMAKYAAKTGLKDEAIRLAGAAASEGKAVRTLYNAAIAFGLAGQCARSTELLRQAFEHGYPAPEAHRDPDLARLRAAPLSCAVPSI